MATNATATPKRPCVTDMILAKVIPEYSGASTSRFKTIWLIFYEVHTRKCRWSFFGQSESHQSKFSINTWIPYIYGAYKCNIRTCFDFRQIYTNQFPTYDMNISFDSDIKSWHMQTTLFVIALTHLPLVQHICVSKSGQRWFRWWLVAYSAPSNYLNQCCFIVNWTLRSKLQWNSNQNTKLFIRENVPETIVCEVAAICPGEMRWDTTIPSRMSLLPHKIGVIDVQLQ